MLLIETIICFNRLAQTCIRFTSCVSISFAGASSFIVQVCSRIILFLKVYTEGLRSKMQISRESFKEINLEEYLQYFRYQDTGLHKEKHIRYDVG